jgi:hypothetical protein
MPESLRQSPDNLKPVPFPEMDCDPIRGDNQKEGTKDVSDSVIVSHELPPVGSGLNHFQAGTVSVCEGA